ncbi:hypothetical protein V6Z11_D08G137900 [Gossypium hirsutum]
MALVFVKGGAMFNHGPEMQLLDSSKTDRLGEKALIHIGYSVPKLGEVKEMIRKYKMELNQSSSILCDKTNCSFSSIFRDTCWKRRRAINEGQSSAALGIHWPLGGEH